MSYTEDQLANHNRLVYDALADEYERKASWRLADHEQGVDTLTKFLEPGSSVLNLACAVGLDAYWFNKEGFDVVGIDIAPGMIKHAQKRVPAARFIEADFLNTDFGDQKFDAVFAWAFIHLFPGEQADHVLEKIHQVMKVGGLALLSTTKSESSSEGWLAKADYAGGNKLERYRRHWTRDELGASLQANGFEPIEYTERIFPDKQFMVYVAQAVSENKRSE